MKKRLTVIMMCLLAYPLTSTSVLAATHCKKHCKKCAHKQLDAAKTPFKDASPAETAQEANADFWSGMSGVPPSESLAHSASKCLRASLSMDGSKLSMNDTDGLSLKSGPALMDRKE